jgi:hypothetical protein
MAVPRSPGSQPRRCLVLENLAIRHKFALRERLTGRPRSKGGPGAQLLWLHLLCVSGELAHGVLDAVSTATQNPQVFSAQ